MGEKKYDTKKTYHVREKCVMIDQVTNKTRLFVFPVEIDDKLIIKIYLYILCHL